jgi:hypothetical protein
MIGSEREARLRAKEYTSGSLPVVMAESNLRPACSKHRDA